MIYRFTDEQQKKLTEIEIQISELNFSYHPLMVAEPPYTDDSGKTYNTREEYKKHLDKTVPQKVATLYKSFNDLLNQFEKDHMQSLKTPAAILEDAMLTASDGMYVAFIKYMDGQNGILADGRGDDKNGKPPADDPNKPIEKTVYIMPSEGAAAPLQPFDWNYAERIDALRGTETTPPQLDVLMNQPFCFDETGSTIWLNNHIIKHHEEMLKGTPEHDELPRMLFRLVDDLPFTENFTTSEYWQKVKHAKETNEQANNDLKKNAAETDKNKKVMALNYYAVPTSAGFEHALAISDDEKDRAHIVPIDLKMNEKPSEITVDEETGRLYYGGRQIELADFRELKKKGFQPINPNDYNIGLLNLMLSAYNEYHKNDLQVTADNSEIQKEELSVSRKDLFNYYKDHDSRDRLDRYISDFTKLSGLGAKLKENSKSSIPSYYPVFVFKGYSSISDTFDFEFVYFPKLRNAMLREAIQTKKDGTPKLKNSGQPYQRAYITELIHPEIVKEKNYAARQNVEIIIQVIEKTGGPLPIKKKNEKGKLQIVGYQKYATPNITLKELINRNYYLKNQLENQAETKSKNQLLKRCMTRTWYLLENMTDVKLKYPDIELPKLAQAGKNGKYYKYYKPTVKDIDSGLKYTFRHGEIAKDWR